MLKASWFQSNFEDDASKPAGNVRRESSSEPSAAKALIKKNATDIKLQEYQTLNWLKAFMPKQIQELSIHPKKLDDLQNWFKISCEKKCNQILLLEGPAGSGKTIALKLVAQESGYEVVEWTNATDLETASTLYADSINREFVTYENQVAKFSDFLLNSSRFRSIFNKRKRLLLVKDFPNTFTRKTEEFWDILRRYVEEAQSPLVFVVTHSNSKSLNISFNLFPDNIRRELGIDTIALNPVSTTMMRRALKRICQQIEGNENYSPYFTKPADNVIDSLIEQSQGDIRNAVLNLNFASQKSQLNLKPNVCGSSRKKGKMSKQISTGIGKNEALTLLHGVGRVLYPKLETNSITKIKELTHKPEDIAESFSSQPKNFMQMINSNYIKCYSSIEEVSEAAEFHSLSDRFEAEYRDPQLIKLNLDMTIRAVMILNEKPARGFRPVSAKADKKWKNTEEANHQKFIAASRILNNGNIMPRKDFFCDYILMEKIY